MRRYILLIDAKPVHQSAAGDFTFAPVGDLVGPHVGGRMLPATLFDIEGFRRAAQLATVLNPELSADRFGVFAVEVAG